MPNEPIKQVNKLMVGQLDFSFIPSVPVIPGTSVLNGPVWIGAGVPAPTANCMIGPGLNPITLEVKGISNIIGNTNITGLLTVEGSSVFNSANTVEGVTIFNGNITVNASEVINGPLIVNGATHINGFLSFTSSIVGVTKSFDIPHPIKEGWRLRHVCLEGPTADVYVRGKLDNSNIIELPKYWVKLVDTETITVNLTPIGTYQELFVEKIEWGTKIYIKNSSGTSIKCYYTVYGERKDTLKNIPEYEGTEIKENCKIEV